MKSFRQPVANTVLLEDVSTSMTERIDGSLTKIDALKEANRILIAYKIKQCPDDLLACVIFSDTAHVLFKLTNPASPWVLDRIERMRVGGMTNITHALEMGIRLLECRHPRFLRNIILLSDGEANTGDPSRLTPLAQQAFDRHININTIGFGHSSLTFDEAMLKRIAAATHNGKYTHARGLQPLADALINFS